MISRFLLSTFAAAIIIGALALAGWGIVTIVEHHLRSAIGFAVCALAAIVYAEIGPASMEQH